LQIHDPLSAIRRISCTVTDPLFFLYWSLVTSPTPVTHSEKDYCM